uniref:G-protein coupled receptors family 1 profile domain-containing protein n=1 Tax=Globodera rostochiensis TaxID=31243 RepID=A0A914ICL0_GLORO
MECLLNSECYNGHYNCTFYDSESIPREMRRNVVPGVVLLTFYVIFELISVPCIVIFAQKNNRRESCFKMLLFMGLLNMVNINSSCLVIGIYAIRGDGFCDRPLFNYILGMIGYAFYACESTMAIVLALNRCIAMANNRLAVALFDGHKLSIWFSVVVVYAFCTAFLFIPPLPNGMLVAYFWQPHIGYVEDTEGWYVHELYLYHSFVIGFGIPIIYGIFYFIIWKKSMRNVGVEQGGQQSCPVDQKRNQKIFVQVLLNSLMTMTFALLYVYMQYFSVPPWFVIAGHFSWACSQGMFPIILIVFNSQIRNSIKAVFTTFVLNRFSSNRLNSEAGNGIRNF